MMVMLDGAEATAATSTRTWPTLATSSLPRCRITRCGEPDRLAAVVGAQPRLPDPAARARARPGGEPLRSARRASWPAWTRATEATSASHARWGALGQGDDPALPLGVGDLFAGGGGARPLASGVVVPHPRVPERPRERLTLPSGRVDPGAVPDQHAAEYGWSMRQDADYRRGSHVVSALTVHLVL